MPPDGENLGAVRDSLSFVGTADGLDRWRSGHDAQRQEIGGRPRILHYLSVPPSASPGSSQSSDRRPERGRAGDHGEAVRHGPCIGAALNATLHRVFDESQIFRIDHFLGKEAVQNILALRFANGMFEPVWNRNHIDHVQIDVPETLSIGTRAALLREHGRLSRHGRDTPLSGARLRRDGAPHVARGEGARRREDQGVRRDAAAATRDVVRGQYEGYRDEEGVAPDSETETFVAVRAQVDNWRWAGVPFFLRTGNVSPRAAICSRSRSSSRRVACSRSTPLSRRSRSGATTSRSSSATPAASR